MRGFRKIRSFTLALTLGISALALGGCAMETASGDPASTSAEEGTLRQASGAAHADPGAGEASESPALVNPTKAVTNSGKPTAAIAAAALHEQVVSDGCRSNSNNCGQGSQGQTEPLPWVITH